MAIKVQFNPSTLKASYIAANNKVQTRTTCKGADETYTLIFSGVTACAAGDCPDSWPSDINTTFVLSYISDDGDAFIWRVTTGGWIVVLSCFYNEKPYGYWVYAHNSAMSIIVFQTTAISGSPINNRFVLGDCGGIDSGLCIDGYGGQVIFS